MAASEHENGKLCGESAAALAFGESKLEADLRDDVDSVEL